MSSIKISIILSILLTPFLCLAQNGSNNSFDPSTATYIWPTDASSHLTSTFAETRSAHFHSALDIKTWGRKGYKVFATRSGVLHRIAIGPNGYGKVLYLRHENNTYSVYAHLLRFEENIQQLADSIRLQDYSFEIDRNVEHLNIRVKQGDVIGLTGASGIGPPHLHFELRTPSHEPFNPLLTNLNVEDTIAPQFSRLSVEPLAIESKIEGENRIFTKRAWKNNGSYTFGSIDISGPVGLGIDVFDQANGVYNAYAVYELKMFVDDSLRFHSKTNQFSYLETNQMFIDRVYPLLEKYNAGYQRLYIKKGNTLPFYESRDRNAELHLAPGDHRLRIIAKDYFGNKSEASATLRVPASSKKAGRIDFNPPKQNEPVQLKPNQWSWFDDWVNIPSEQARNLTLALSASSDIIVEDSQLRVKLDQKKDFFFRGSYKSHFIARRISADSISFIPSSTDQSFVRFDPGTFYEDASSALYIQQFAADSIKAEVLPSSQPLKNSFKLAIELDSIQQKMPKLSVYSFNERKQKLNYLESTRVKNYLFANPEQLGTFYVLQDTSPPLLKNARLHQREDGQWLIYIEATDDLAGINHKTASISVNGARGIAEFEPEDDRLVYYHPDFKPTPQMKISASVEDMEGNKTNASFQLVSESDK
ncbi:MAG: M23 family metallopeptidase [Balneolaceae bacterium]|nr:M23 family metallopeptidase [Balneolaceae bacterium]